MKNDAIAVNGAQFTLLSDCQSRLCLLAAWTRLCDQIT
jgi:hypothetical protein